MNKRREKKAFKKLFDMSRNMTSEEIKVAHKTFVRMLWKAVSVLVGGDQLDEDKDVVEVVDYNGATTKGDS